MKTSNAEGMERILRLYLIWKMSAIILYFIMKSNKQNFFVQIYLTVTSLASFRIDLLLLRKELKYCIKSLISSDSAYF